MQIKDKQTSCQHKKQFLYVEDSNLSNLSQLIAEEVTR